MSSVQQGCSRIGGEIFDAILSLSILMVGVWTAEGDGLVVILYTTPKGLGIKKAVVGMVVANSYSVLCRDPLKSLFCLNCVIRIHGGH